MPEFSENQKEYLDNLFKNITTVLAEKTADLKNELKTQISEIKNEFNSIIYQDQEKIATLESRNKELQEAIIQLQRRTRKNNIVVFGIKEDQQNIVEQVTTTLNNTLEIEILISDISDAYKIGKNNTEDKPIIVELISYQKKLHILKNAYKLKGKNISIANDLCWEDRENKKILIKHLKEARNKGVQAYIKGHKLIIADEPYTADDLEKSKSKGDTSAAVETQTTESLSAPATPNPEARHKRLLQGLDVEEIEQDQKKAKPSTRTQKKRQGAADKK